jgi:hypothetical protein
VVSTDKDGQIVQISQLFLSHYPVGNTCSSSTSRSSSSVDEEFKLGREVEMDYIFEKWDIDTSGSQVCDEQEICVLTPKLDQLVFSGTLIHRSVDEVCFESRFNGKFTQILNVIPGCGENNRLFSCLYPLSQSVHQGCFFFNGAHNEKVNL